MQPTTQQEGLKGLSEAQRIGVTQGKPERPEDVAKSWRPLLVSAG